MAIVFIVLSIHSRYVYVILLSFKLFYSWDLSPPSPPTTTQFSSSHHPVAPVLYHASEHRNSCSLISVSTTLRLLPRLLPTCSLSRPTNFLVPLSVRSLLTNLQTLHHHEPFQQRSWSSLGDPYLLTVTLPVCVSECPRLLFFLSLQSEIAQEPCTSASLQMQHF